MIDKNKIVEEPVVEVIRKVCDRFVAASRAFSSRSKVRQGQIVYCSRSVVVLFPNGRWTTTRDVDRVIPYKLHREYAAICYNSSGRRGEQVEIDGYLNALVALGVVSREDAAAFRAWCWKHIDFTLTKGRIAKLKKELAEEEEELAKFLEK